MAPKFHRAFGCRASLWIFFLWLASSVPAQNTNLSYAPPGDWVRSVEWKMPAEKISSTNTEGLHYLLYEFQQNPELSETFTRVVSQMENETGVQDSGSLTFNFDPSFQQLVLHYVRIHRRGQVFDRLDRSKVRLIQPEPDLDGHVLSGVLKSVIFVEDLRVGDALEYAYTTRGENPIMAGHFTSRFYVQTGEPIDRQRMRVVWTSPKPLQVRQHLIQQLPEKRPWKAGTEYVWDFPRLTGVTYEDYLPLDHEPNSQVELSDFPDWASMVNWALPLYAITNGDMPPELKALVAGWQAKDSSEEKARLALQFVQDELRYTGLELGPDSHRPTPPFETFQKRFGDCKGKTVLYCAILRAMGIEAHPALVNSSVRGAIARRLPSPYVFNHVVVKLVLDGKEIWVDPTLSHQGGRLGERYMPLYGKALVIQPGVTDLENVLSTRIPLLHQKVTSTFRIKDYKSPAGFDVKTIYWGYEADGMRENLARTKMEDMAKDYLNYYARYYPGIEKSGTMKVSDDRVGNVLTLAENYHINNLWNLKESKQRREATFYADTLVNYLTDPTTRLRKMPLRIAFPNSREQDLVIYLPDQEWNVSDEEHKVESDAFFYRSSRNLSGSCLKLHYECQTRAARVPAEDVAAYLKKHDEMQGLLGETLFYPEGSTDVLGRINWPMVVVAAFGMVITLAACLVVYHWTKRRQSNLPPPLPLAEGPEGLGGWLILIAFGMVVGLVLRSILVVNNWESFFAVHIWQAVATPTGHAYHPLYGPILVYELLGNIALGGLNLFALILFFSKKRLFPKVYITLLAGSALYLAGDDIMTTLIPALKDKADAGSRQNLVRAIAGALLWSSYMLKSRRVKATFVN